MKNITLYLLAAIALTGCASAGDHSVDEQLLNDKGWGRASVISTTAERRAVIVRVPAMDKNGNAAKERNIQACAEPSPDVAEAVTGSLRAVVEAATKNGGADGAKISADLMSSYATSLTVLTRRSQGVQFFRDGLYSLCQFHMNGAISEQNFIARYDKLVEEAKALVMQELKDINQAKLDQAVKDAQAAAGESGKQANAASAKANEASQSADVARKAADEVKANNKPKS